jgi:polar amino acid transport system substrate-binding protein
LSVGRHEHWEVSVLRMVSVLAAVVLAGCGWPKDAGTTLADVRGGVMSVGVTEHRPWTRVADDATVTGAEVRLVERLAARLGARVEWHTGSESMLMAALRDRVLDLVVGGLDSKAPWMKEASLTRSFVTMRTMVAVPAGVPAPRDLAGVRVAVTAGTAEIADVIRKGAVPVPVPEIAGTEGMPVVVGEWRVAELDLRATGHEVAKHDHVWAVPLGENGWQVEVERFLLALSHGEVVALLAEAERAEARA